MGIPFDLDQELNTTDWDVEDKEIRLRTPWRISGMNFWRLNLMVSKDVLQTTVGHHNIYVLGFKYDLN